MYDISTALGSVGDLAGWAHGVAVPSEPITTLAAGTPGVHQNTTNSAAPGQSIKVMHTMSAIVLVALALLWISGTVVFKGARLP